MELKTQYSRTWVSWYKILLIHLLLGVCMPGRLLAQNENTVNFQSIRKELPNQFVRCFLKDSKGFMWFGTHNGLTRYDGVNFVVYETNPDDPNSLSHNYISSIVEDKNHNIWVGTFRGLNLYNPTKNNFSRLNFKRDYIVINNLCDDSRGNLWIGTIGNGLIKFNLAQKRATFYTRNSSVANYVSANHITGIAADNHQRLWVASWAGLDYLDLRSDRFTHVETNMLDTQHRSKTGINALCLDRNTLWLGTLQGELQSLNTDTRPFAVTNGLRLSDIRTEPPSNILSLCADKQHKLWMGVENGGLLHFDPATKTYDRYLREEGNNAGLNSNTTRCVYIDKLNILWVGTLGRGVNFWDPRFHRFESFKRNASTSHTLCGEDVSSFAEDSKGNIWISTYGGISLFNPQSRTFTQSITRATSQLSSDAVTSLKFDAAGKLWVGTWGGGVDCFDKDLRKLANYSIKGTHSAGENKVLSLLIDSQDDVWAGSAGTGLFKLDKKAQSFIQILDAAQQVNQNTIGFVTSLIEDAAHNIWVGTAYRLYCFKPIAANKYSIRIFARDTIPGALPSDGITTLFEDRNRNIWVGTSDQGLALFNAKDSTFTCFNKQNGLPSNTICGILEDQHNNLWISTNKGISKFNRMRKTTRSFTSEDGLVSNEFYNNSCLRTKTGRFLFGTSEGFSSFSPDYIKDNPSSQAICFTDFKLFNKSVVVNKGDFLKQDSSLTKTIVLKYNQSSFSIEFVALNFIQGSKSQYAYRLKGLENEWNIVSHQNSASYNYLKPGKYTFEVKGSNNDGVWNETPARLQIEIRPPFWQTTWAYAVYLLLCVTIIYVYVRYRVEKAKQDHILELNQMKLQFFANISHELRTPLTLILSPVENMIASSKISKDIADQLQMVYKNASRLFSLVNEIMDFTKIEASKLELSVQSGDVVIFTRELTDYFRDEALRRNIQLQIQVTPSSIELWADWMHYEKILFNLLSNAMKFTPDNGAILVSIEVVNFERNPEIIKNTKFANTPTVELLKITVEDNGMGITASDLNKVFDRFYQGKNANTIVQAGTGIGLSLTKTLVELHHGTISAQSEIGKGSAFTVLMPLGKQHFTKKELSSNSQTPSHKAKDTSVFALSPNYSQLTAPQNAATILLVEDNYELRKYIQYAFSAQYKIIEAADGAIGYEMAKDLIPDLIISDVIMPNLSGIEFCKRIKQNLVTSHIPIILLTAKVTLEDQLMGLEIGADAYITKPFNVKQLELTTRNLIETRQKLYKRFSQDVYISPQEITENHLDQDFLEKAINYIETNISSVELSVENLAAHLNMSSTHVWRKIKSLSGQSTTQFIRTIRLKNAIKLMESNKFQLSEIGYMVGFSSPSYFTKCFREQYGKSPSNYLAKEGKE